MQNKNYLHYLQNNSFRNASRNVDIGTVGTKDCSHAVPLRGASSRDVQDRVEQCRVVSRRAVPRCTACAHTAQLLQATFPDKKTTSISFSK